MLCQYGSGTVLLHIPVQEIPAKASSDSISIIVDTTGTHNLGIFDNDEVIFNLLFQIMKKVLGLRRIKEIWDIGIEYSNDLLKINRLITTDREFVHGSAIRVSPFYNAQRIASICP